MRRALLTAGAPAWPDVAGTVGTLWSSGGSAFDNASLMIAGETATAKTVMKSFTVRFADTPAVTYRLLSGVISGTSFIVRDSTPDISVGSGGGQTNSHSGTLKCDVGDRLAIWQPDPGNRRNVAFAASGAGIRWVYGLATPPVAGDTVTGLSSASGRLYIYGSNP